VWSYRADGGIVAGPVISEGKLYIGSLDRKLRAFELSRK